MRIKISFLKVHGSSGTVPLHHQKIISAFLEEVIREMPIKSEFYNFSSLKGTSKVQAGQIRFLSSKVSLVLSAPEGEFLQMLVNEIFERRLVSFAKLTLVPKSYEVMADPEFKTVMKYVCISPMVSQPPFEVDASGNIPDALDPRNQEFSDLFYDAVIDQMEKAGFDQNQLGQFAEFEIMPDAGYAEITGATTAAGAQPNGNVDPRGAGYGAPYQGITLGERQLTTIKMLSKTYLGHETEEDSLIPILPLIREAMVRSHARGVENLFLAGNTNQGPYTSGAANGLLRFAATAGRTITASALTTPMTGAALFGMRKLMGKYGLDPRNIVYIVSQDAYFQLVEDPEFADADLVGIDNASKLNGQVGRVYGSQVLMCDEFAPAGPNNYFALALNTRNFVVPRLRGMTMESQYLVEDQHTVMVASQRLGFDEIIQNATSVVGLKYPAS